MEYLGLIFEIIILIGAIILYLASRGAISSMKDTEFIKKNNTIIRLGSLALIAVMGFNIYLHLAQMM